MISFSLNFCWFFFWGGHGEGLLTRDEIATYADREVQHLLNEFFVFDGAERSHDADFLFL